MPTPWRVPLRQRDDTRAERDVAIGADSYRNAEALIPMTARRVSLEATAVGHASHQHAAASRLPLSFNAPGSPRFPGGNPPAASLSRAFSVSSPEALDIRDAHAAEIAPPQVNLFESPLLAAQLLIARPASTSWRMPTI